MKRKLFLLTLSVALLSTTVVQAQLPDGSIAPDFTVTDSNGETHQLYNYLDQGYTVILQLFAAWSGPDWNYHNAGTSHPFPGALNEVYNLYGPGGTNEIMVIAIESDPNTDPSQITGGEFSIGDWTAGVDYPVADDEGIFALYEQTFWPTIFTICPSRLLTQSGQVSAAEHYSIAEAVECQLASLPNDPALVFYDGETEFCQGIELSASIMNQGLNLLTELDFEISYNGSVVGAFNWTGALETYGIEQVTLGNYNLQGDGQLAIEIVSANDNENNDLLEVLLAAPVSAGQDIQITVNTDSWGEETGWSITDEFGNVVAAVEAGTYASETEYIENVQLGNGCYYFQLTDAFGDGMNGSFYGGADGSCTVESFVDGSFYSLVFEDDGSSQWSARGIYLLVGNNPGCLDPLACNYTPDAAPIVSCTYPGCSDPEACNYDAVAGCDDGSCTYPGCDDPVACNYDASAGCDSGTCIFPGCNDPLACNYDALAGCDNGACSYPVEVLITGPVVVSTFSSSSYSVVQETGLNYQWEVTGGAITGSDDESAVEVFWGPQGTGEICVTIDQSTCLTQTDCINVVIAPDNAVPGCTNAGACNYNPNATADNGSCIFVGDACDDGDAETVNDVIQADCSCEGEMVVDMPGCTNSSACNYDPNATTDNGSCFYVGDPCNDGNPETTNDTVQANCDCLGETINDVLGCMSPNACNFNAEATLDDGSCLFVGDACDDGDADTINDSIQANCECAGETVNEVPGCTNASACNYAADATLDDGSCFFVGDACDDGDANTINDSIQANCECTGEDPDPSTGCTDPEACNYSPEATTDDGSCEYVELFGVAGNLVPVIFSSEVYSYPETLGSSYQWSTAFGVVTEGQGTPQVTVIWGTQGTGQLCVTETREDGCEGQEVCDNIVVLPTGVEQLDEPVILVYPNPASTHVNVILPDAWLGGTYALLDLQGRLLKQDVIHQAHVVIHTESLDGGCYVLNLFVDDKTITKQMIITK